MRNIVALSLCITFPTLSAAQSQTETTEWGAVAPFHNAVFGRSLAIDGSVAVIGSPGYSVSSTGNGAVHILDLGSGAELFFVTSPAAVQGGSFGRDVGVFGSTAVAGAPAENGDVGFAYVIDTNTGSIIHQFSPPAPASYERFGSSVDIHGTTVIVGAEAADGLAAHSGAAYLFDAVSGLPLAKLVASDGATSDSFGEAVAIYANTAIVGARYQAANGNGAGAAYLFDVTTGNQVGKLLALDGSAQDRFGCSVDIDGGIAVVGARRDTPNGGTSGSAYSFDVGLGAQLAKFVPSDGGPGHLFGDAIAIRGSSVVIGAHGHNLNGDAAGAAYLFDAVTGVQRARFLPSTGGPAELFGNAVAVESGVALVGAPWRNIAGEFINPGAVALFDSFPPVSNTGSANCFGDGSGAPCPCAANGNLGEGCANSGGAGASLTGTGMAYEFNGSFEFQINGVPGSKPGLMLKANNQVAVPAGDGLLCVAGGSQRSHIQVTSNGSTTFTNFNGASLPTVGGLGSSSNWQFWYRDPANTCSGAGFNFTNAWTVTFLP